MCCLLQTAVGGGHGAGLESAEARRGAVPGCAAGLHCPHQLLLRLHSGSHSGALSCLCHTPRSKVNTCTDSLAFIALYHYTELKLFFSLQGFVSVHLGHPQPSLHAPVFSFFLSRAARHACQLPRWLVAVSISHFTGDPGPLPVRIFSLPTHSLAGLSMLAAFLEHPLLEVAHRSTEGSCECDRPPKCTQVCHCWVNVKNYQLNPLERKKQCTVVALEKTQQLHLHVWTFGYYVYSKYFSL